MRPRDELFEIEDVKRLVHVQLAKSPVLVAAAVIIQPVGDVGGLLHLADEASRADGVHRPRFQKIRIPFFDGNAVEHLRERIVRDAAAHFLFRHVPFKADIQAGVRRGVEHVPHLVLAVLPFHRQGILICGMHLDGEVFFGVDELDHEREALVSLRLPAEPLPADGVDVVGEGEPGVLAVRDRRFAVRMGGEFPAFADRPLASLVLFEDVAQSGAAP